MNNNWDENIDIFEAFKKTKKLFLNDIGRRPRLVMTNSSYQSYKKYLARFDIDIKDVFDEPEIEENELEQSQK